MAEQRPIQAQQGKRQEKQEEKKQTGGLAPPQRAGLSRQEAFSPFGMVRRLMEDMDRIFGFGPTGGGLPTRQLDPFENMGQELWVPAIETFERDGKLVLHAELPGLRSEDVKIEVIGRELVISGERRQEQEKTRGGRAYSERRYGSFERRLSLPTELQPENVEATFDNGILEVAFPVPEQRKSRTVEVKSRSGTEKKTPGAVH